MLPLPDRTGIYRTDRISELLPNLPIYRTVHRTVRELIINEITFNLMNYYDY